MQAAHEKLWDRIYRVHNLFLAFNTVYDALGYKFLKNDVCAGH